MQHLIEISEKKKTQTALNLLIKCRKAGTFPFERAAGCVRASSGALHARVVFGVVFIVLCGSSDFIVGDVRRGPHWALRLCLAVRQCASAPVRGDYVCELPWWIRDVGANVGTKVGTY